MIGIATLFTFIGIGLIVYCLIRAAIEYQLEKELQGLDEDWEKLQELYRKCAQLQSRRLQMETQKANREAWEAVQEMVTVARDLTLEEQYKK